MKKSFSCIAFIALFFTSFMASAQSKNTLSFGVTVGPSYSTIQKEGSSYGSRLAIGGGLLLNYSATSSFGLGAELNYAPKGGKFDGNTGFTSNVIRRQNLDYVEIPIYCNFFFGEEGFRPKFMLGGSIGQLLLARDITEDTSRDTKTAVDIKKDYNSMDFCILGGAGMHYRLNNKFWLVGDIRASYTLVPIQSPKSVAGQLDRDTRNLVIAGRIALTLPLKTAE
ncbi:MAG: PorT family protein [Cytophagales bacterium]|nr:MAG: PorT family protein [Cytophagales bacterium]TAF59477.1 MAG: PorT family protein [Cytophagales bacterium]